MYRLNNQRKEWEWGGDEKTTLPKASRNTNWVFLPHGVSPETFQHLHETITNGNGVVSNWMHGWKAIKKLLIKQRAVCVAHCLCT